MPLDRTLDSHARAKFFNTGPFGKGTRYEDSRLWVGKNGCMYGVWEFGNDYRNKTTYYGAYPPSYLDRIMSLFPDAKQHRRILHLFSGSLADDVFGMRVDINYRQDPDILWDAQDLSNAPGLEEKVDLIIADPPYSIEDAKRYGAVMVNRKRVIEECYKVLRVGGWVVWLDQALPMYRKREFRKGGMIFSSRSTNHRVRCTTLFQKRAHGEVE